MSKVIIFGATGNVGSVAAKTAAEHGAKVYLAMRDPNKTIPGLDEKSGSFERVKADLMDSNSLTEAIKTSGAKRGFFYLAHGSQDHMKASIEAMKEAGLEFVVFLSSFTVTVPDEQLRDVPQSEMIPYMHAHVEANLIDIFGIGNFVALRPGAFATNNFRYKQGIQAGEVPLYGGKIKPDNITPGDMGRVAGTILVNGPKNSQKHVYLYGPDRTTTHDGILQIGKALGKDIKIKELSADEAVEEYSQLGMGVAFAKYRVRAVEEWEKNEAGFAEYDTGKKNHELYTGKPAQSFQSWIEENRHAFEA